MNKIDYSNLTIFEAEAKNYSFVRPPSDIIFYNNLGNKQVEVLRISKEGITANPDVPVDEAADAVIRALDTHIKQLVNRTWVGLTDEEFVEACQMAERGNYLVAFQLIQAKLRSKNG